jgi:Domain of unknown function (DUF6894)
MAIYYFDLRDDDKVVLDEEGTELSSMDEVQNEAAYALADMLRDQLPIANGNGLARDLIVEVRDGGGPVMHTRFAFEMQHLR